MQNTNINTNTTNISKTVTPWWDLGKHPITGFGVSKSKVVKSDREEYKPK